MLGDKGLNTNRYATIVSLKQTLWAVLWYPKMYSFWWRHANANVWWWQHLYFRHNITNRKIPNGNWCTVKCFVTDTSDQHSLTHSSLSHTVIQAITQKYSKLAHTARIDFPFEARRTAGPSIVHALLVWYHTSAICWWCICVIYVLWMRLDAERATHISQVNFSR